jgi:hypothetical protein
MQSQRKKLRRLKKLLRSHSQQRSLPVKQKPPKRLSLPMLPQQSQQLQLLRRLRLLVSLVLVIILSLLLKAWAFLAQWLDQVTTHSLLIRA